MHQMLLRLVREKIPFFVLAAVASVMTFVVQKRGGTLAMGENLLTRRAQSGTP